MFHSRGLNNRIAHIHETALKIIYQYYNSSFKELLGKDKTKINKNVLMECQKQKSICILKDFIDRSSHWKCSVRKGVCGSFAKFTGKHLCQSLFFNKVALHWCTAQISKGTLFYKYSLNFKMFLLILHISKLNSIINPDLSSQFNWPNSAKCW